MYGLRTSLSRVLARPFSAGAMPPLKKYDELFAKAVGQFGDRPCLIFDGDHGVHESEVGFTFTEIDERSNRLGRHLRDRYGVREGDVVISAAGNRPEQMTLLMACLKIGAPFVPLAVDLKPADMQTVVGMYGPKVIVSDSKEHWDHFVGDMPGAIFLEPYRAGMNPVKEMEEDGDGSIRLSNDALLSDPAIMFSTSGSTGLPKGVVYSGQTVGFIGMISDILKAFGQEVPNWGQPGDKQLLWVPFRGVGSTLLVLKDLTLGITQVMVETRDGGPSGPEQWIPLLEKHEIKSFLLFGAAMNQMVMASPEKTFPSLNSITYGGSCFPPSLVQQSMRQFPNAEFEQSYAMTEMLPISSLGPEHHKRDGATAAELKIMASAGKATAPSKVFLEDSAHELSGKPPPPEAKGVGQICAWGPTIMSGYYKDEAKTAAAIGPDGYMRTGDLGRMDEDGFLHVVGRMKEVIPTHRGFNVVPRDIEEIAFQHPSVAQAACIGIPHPSGAGEMVVAWVVAKSGLVISETEVYQHFQALETPSWQIPEIIHVSPDPLPVVGGKVNKKLLQAPTFVAANLATSIEGVQAKAKAANDWTLLARDLFERMDMDGDGHLDLQELEAVFGTASGQKILWSLDRPSGNKGGSAAAGVDLGNWFIGLSQLDGRGRDDWLNEASSLLAALERAAITG